MSQQDPKIEAGEAKQEPDQPTGFITHLIELRNRLMWMLGLTLIVFASLVGFSQEIYTTFAGPLIATLPQGSSMVAIDVTAPFLIPVKVTFFLALFICIPYLLYHIWAFIAPGLYKHERRLALPLLSSSILLFYAGTAFAYFVVLPLAFDFFVNFAPDGVAVMTDVGRYVDFVLAMFFAFGLAFEVPVATVLMVLVGITTPQKLAEYRPYVIVAAFVIGMLLTPPDVISQTLLALPMLILYEFGIIFARMLKKNNKPDPKPEIDL